MNELSKYDENLWERYGKYKTRDTAKTDVSLLKTDQLGLVEKALNATFINPKFKMKHFVSMGQITPYSTVKQWVLELKTAEENCETFDMMLDKLKLQAEVLEIRISREDDVLTKKELELELLKVKYDLRTNSRRHAQHYIERDQYIELIQEYLEGPNGKTPEGKSWLDVLGTPEEDKWEKHYWQVRLARQAAMDVVAYGRISAGNMEAINQLAAADRDECLALTHEMSLRLNSMNDDIRSQIHDQLMITDQDYARANGKSPKDPNYVELDVSIKQHPAAGSEDLLDVYNS